MKLTIKHIVFGLSLLLGFTAFGQIPLRLRHASELFLIEQNTNVKIKGGLESLDGNNSNSVINLGNIYVSDSIVNKGGVYVFGSLPDTLGHVYLDGTKNQKFGGKAIYFSNLTINNSADTVFVHKDTVYITKKVHFTEGKINVDEGVLHLKRTPYLWGNLNGSIETEDSASHVFGYPGYIKMYRPLTLGQSYNDLHGTGLSLKVDGNIGSRTEVRRYHREQDKVSNGSIERYFQFYPSINDDISNISMTYLDTVGINSNEPSQMAVYFSSDNGLGWRELKSTVDSTLNKVSANKGITINNQTRITISEDTCDVLPYVNIPRDTFPLCSGTSIYIPADSVSDLEVLWSNNITGVDSILVNSPGMYWVKVTSDGGCINYDTCYVVAAPDPQPGFFAAPHCLGDSAFFSDTSSISSGTISYQWDFGDPFSNSDTSSSKLPKYLYTKFGTFNAKVTLESNYGCVKSVSRPVVVLPIPEAKFSINNHCVDSTIALSNQSKVPGNLGLTYLWRFGDGDTSVLANPSHSYSRDTVFRVQLLATSQGCSDSVFKSVTIYPNPEPKFVFKNACRGNLVQFTDSSRINSGNLSYNFNLGNGRSSALKNPSTTYNSVGNFIVNLTVISDKNCRASYRDTVIVHPIPVANFSVVNACAGDSVSFVNSSTISSGSFTSSWNLGGVGNSSLNSPKMVFTSPANYSSKLVVTSDSGCVDSVLKPFVVYPSPVSAFTASNACVGDLVTFTNSSSVGNGNLSYQWIFGNGDSSVVKSPNTRYSSAGTTSVLLVSNTGNGCRDSLSRSITIHAKPSVNLGTSITTCGSSIELDAGNLGSTYNWNNSRRTQKITAVANGLYSVTVTNAQRCSASDTVSVQLFTAVRPNLGPDISVCDSIVLLSGYGATSSSAVWTGGITSHSLTVRNSGIYAVTITDPNNCSGSDSINITVNNSPILDLGPDITACSDSTILLTSNQSVPTYRWSTGANTNQINPIKSGSYRLTITDVNNCSDVDTVEVLFNSIPAFSLGADQEICDSLELRISGANGNYLWSNGDTSNRTLVSQTGQVWAQVQSSKGCSHRDTIQIVVNASPLVDLGEDTTLCFGTEFTVDAGWPGSKYQWSSGDTSQSLLISSSQKATVIVIDTNNCSGEDSISVVVNPPFVLDLGPDEPLCKNTARKLSPGIKKSNYVWAGTAGFNSTDSAVTLTDTGTYWLQITDSAGCVANDTIELLYTDKEIKADFTAADEVFTGDTVAFINLSFPKPDQQTWILHDGFTSPNQHVFYPYFVEGVYDVKLAVSNSQCADTLTKQLTVKLRTRNQKDDPEALTNYVEISNIHLYPNPTSGNLNVEIEMTGESDITVQLFDIYGRLWAQNALYGRTFKLLYNVKGRSNGMYFIRCIAGKSIMTKKFIKVR